MHQNLKFFKLKKLNTIQNQTLRITTGAFYTSPIVNLHVDINEMFFTQHRDFKLIMFYASHWLNKWNIKYYRTIHSLHKSTTVTTSGQSVTPWLTNTRSVYLKIIMKLCCDTWNITFSPKFGKRPKKNGLNCQWKDFISSNQTSLNAGTLKAYNAEGSSSNRAYENYSLPVLYELHAAKTVLPSDWE